MNFPKIHLSRSSDRKMNKKTKQKKASGVEWSKLQREGGEGGGGREVEGFWLFSTRFIRSFEGK